MNAQILCDTQINTKIGAERVARRGLIRTRSSLHESNEYESDMDLWKTDSGGKHFEKIWNIAPKYAQSRATTIDFDTKTATERAIANKYIVLASNQTCDSERINSQITRIGTTDTVNQEDDKLRVKFRPRSGAMSSRDQRPQVRTRKAATAQEESSAGRHHQPPNFGLTTMNRTLTKTSKSKKIQWRQMRAE